MRFLSILSALVIVLCLSCGDSVEEIWINSDGNGAIHKKIDMSEMISLLRLGMMLEGEDDSMDMGVDEIGQLMTKEKFDTIVHIESMFQEMAEESGEVYSRIWAREKFLEDIGKEMNNPDSLWQIFEPFLDAKIQAKMDMPNEVFEFTFMLPINDFNNIQKLDLDPLLNNVGNQIGENIPFDMNMFSPNLDYDFEFSKKKVVIQIPHMDTVGASSENDLMGMFTDMKAEGTNKKLIVHVPGKVKHVNQSSAIYNDNKVIYEVDYDRLVDKNDDIDLVIDFKPRRKYRYIAPN